MDKISEGEEMHEDRYIMGANREHENISRCGVDKNHVGWRSTLICHLFNK